MVRRDATLTCHQHRIKLTQPNQLSHHEVILLPGSFTSRCDFSPTNQTPSVLRASPSALVGGEGVRPGISGITTVRVPRTHTSWRWHPPPPEPLLITSVSSEKKRQRKKLAWLVKKSRCYIAGLILPINLYLLEPKNGRNNRHEAWQRWIL